MLNKFVGDLAALNRFLVDKHFEYRSAPWLKSSFDDHVWEINVNSSSYAIDWRAILPDQTRLTDNQHATLWTIFRCWLCIQTHPDTTNFLKLAESTIQRRLQYTIQLIDYFLINSKALSLHTSGLQLLTENDVRELIFRYSQDSRVANTVYIWPQRVKELLLAGSNEISTAEVDAALLNNPELACALDEESSLNLTSEQLLFSRCWLWKRGLYKRAHTAHAYLWYPDSVALGSLLYKDTINGSNSLKPVIPELFIFPIDRRRVEMPRAPVRTDTDRRRSFEQMTPILGRLRDLRCLTAIDLPINSSALSAVEDRFFIDELKKLGRYRTLPQKVVLYALRSSIEFFLEYGSAINDCLIALCKKWIENGSPGGFGTFASATDFSEFLPIKLKELGVTSWRIGSQSTGVCKNISSNEYYRALRRHPGLFDLLQVLAGCSYICIGTLMARRQGELTDLDTDCMDASHSWLVFFNRKSGFAGMRERLARPLPPIAAKMIDETIRVQNALRSIGFLNSPGRLIAYHHSNTGQLVAGPAAGFIVLDIFCDYFSMPCDSQGRRYYIRQHQLRRFFAMLFFWGNSFGGMETLRWFLAQTDVEHLYNYITESMTGAALASVKSGYATDRLLENAPEVAELADLLQDHFGTPDFLLMNRDEVESYVLDLLNSNLISIEPHFFKGTDGKCYEILVKVLRSSQNE